MAYAQYKELDSSGVAWLQKKPSHWRIKRLKFSTDLINNKVGVDDSSLPYLGLEHIESWTGRIIDGEIGGSEGLASSFAVGDVLFGKLRPYLAKVHLAQKDGLISSEALVLRSKGELRAEFLKYYMLSRDFINIVDSSTYGSKMPRASWDFIGNLPVLLPDVEEQKAIARFLDFKTAQIDALIAKKKSLLAKLAEKRTALISHAVTRGLDPSVPMKDSGVAWLGEIPAHWELTRVRFVIEALEQGWSPQCNNEPADDGQWGVMKVGCVNGDSFDSSENKALPDDVDPLIQYEINVGDILVSRANTKELLGSAALVKNVRSHLLLCDKLYRMKALAMIDSDYLVRVLRSSIARYHYERYATGSSGSMQNIGQDTLKNLSLPLPPKTEQIAIAECLDAAASNISMQMNKVHMVIDRLQEYRSALITNAVTGKIDVRGFEFPASAEAQEPAHA